MMQAGPGTASTSAFPEHLGKCQNICPWHRPLASSSAAHAMLSQQQAAVGKGKNRLVALLLFFHGVSHAVAFTVAFGMFPRW